jgi:nucleoside phosphorylase
MPSMSVHDENGRARRGNITPRAVMLTALEVEYQQLLKQFERTEECVLANGLKYRTGQLAAADRSQFDGHWEVLLARSSAGNVNAAVVAMELIHLFEARIAIFVGVAGGLKEEVRLGDVVVADRVFYYETVKIKEDMQWRPQIGRPTRRILNHAEFEANELRWLKRVLPKAPRPRPQVHIEPIVAGEKVLTNSQSELAQFIRQHCNKAVAIEMEGHGFLEAIYQSGIEGLVVRGISDHLDDKNSAVHGDDKLRQAQSSAHAVAFALEVLSRLRPAGSAREYWRFYLSNIYQAQAYSI